MVWKQAAHAACPCRPAVGARASTIDRTTRQAARGVGWVVGSGRDGEPLAGRPTRLAPSQVVLQKVRLRVMRPGTQDYKTVRPRCCLPALAAASALLPKPNSNAAAAPARTVTETDPPFFCSPPTFRPPRCGKN